MKLSRRNDWPERLAAFIDGRRHQPFAWFANDCATFFRDAIEAMTDTRIGTDWEGYGSATGAAKRIQKAGGMRELALALGLEDKPLGLCSRGDVVLAQMEGREIFGVCAGNGHWCAPGTEQLEFRPMTEAVAAFEF